MDDSDEKILNKLTFYDGDGGVLVQQVEHDEMFREKSADDEELAVLRRKFEETLAESFNVMCPNELKEVSADERLMKLRELVS